MKAPCSVALYCHTPAEMGWKESEYLKPTSEYKGCPELEWNGERYVCKQAFEPYAKILGIGLGCCSALNTWRKNVRERTGISDNDYKGE
jgi:hypothetical protein